MIGRIDVHSDRLTVRFKSPTHQQTTTGAEDEIEQASDDHALTITWQKPPTCESAWGSEADRRAKPLMHQARRGVNVGSLFTPLARAYHLLDKLDLGPDLDRTAVGPCLHFIEGAASRPATVATTMWPVARMCVERTVELVAAEPLGGTPEPPTWRVFLTSMVDAKDYSASEIKERKGNTIGR